MQKKESRNRKNRDKQSLRLNGDAQEWRGCLHSDQKLKVILLCVY